MRVRGTKSSLLMGSVEKILIFSGVCSWQGRAGEAFVSVKKVIRG